MSYQEEALRLTQDRLERLCLQAGLGTPQCPPQEDLEEMAAKREASAEAAAPATQTDRRKLMDGWAERKNFTTLEWSTCIHLIGHCRALLLNVALHIIKG